MDFLAGGGEMGERIRAFDWAQTSLGPISAWPQSLKTAVRIMLTSRQPFWLGWGPELIKLYNDAYKTIVGGKHPTALGLPASVVWREIWPEIGPMLETAMQGVEGTYVEEQLLIMERNGYSEETYYTFSYSPIPDDEGHAGGIICANTEDTARVIEERQSSLLRELASRTADTREVVEACRLSGNCLAVDARDFTFGLIYLVEKNTGKLKLVGTSNPSLVGQALAPEVVDVGPASTFPFAEALNASGPVVCNLAGFNSLPQTTWGKPSTKVALIAISARDEQDQHGVLVVGLNPFRIFDDSYREFLQRVSMSIGTNIRNAAAYESERRRAEALAELDRAKTAFFSNVSHEFRTPLTLMLGPLEDLLAKSNASLPPHAREPLQIAHRNALRLLKLVNTLLDFSRIEAGRAQSKLEPVDLSAVTAEICAMFRAAVEKADLRLSVDCPPHPEPVYVDLEMWEKIVLNLLSNAFKFTFHGEISVQLRYTGQSAELRVRDSGIGIPQHELTNIFKRFHRVEGAQGRTIEGTGIGLALVSELVNLHGGEIRVESELGRGSVFIISIPLGASHTAQRRISSPHSQAPQVRADGFVEEALRWLPERSTDSLDHPPKRAIVTEDTPSACLTERSKRQKVMVADDNADLRDYLRRLLASDYEVVIASDGEAALIAAREFRPDLILTDLMMPGMDGAALLKAIRSDPQLQTIPTILLSARAGEESRVEGLALGADDYLTKPFNGRELLAKVESQLKLSRLRHEAFSRERALQREVEVERKSAELILESISDGFIALDQEWRFTYVNAAAEQILNKSATELIGKDHWEEFPKTLGTIIEREFRRAITEGATVEFENFYEPWQRWFEVKAYPSTRGLAVYFRDITERKERSKRLETLNRIGIALSSELNLEKLVQAVTDAGRHLTGAAFGAFFYNVKDEKGESYTLYSLSGAPREAFAKFPMPRNTAVFGPTFRGDGPVRVGDILTDPRYGKNSPHSGMPKGHLPVRSYLAASVKSRTGEVLGGLFYGHPEANIFTEESERELVAIAAQASIAIDNANLYRAVENELAAHKRAEEALRAREAELRSVTEALRNSEERFRLAAYSDAITLYEQDSQLRYTWLYPLHPEHKHALGKSDDDLLQNDEGRALVKWKREVLASGEPQRREAWTTLSTGARVYDIFIIPRRNAAGEIVGVAGTALDITERKNAEAALQESEVRLRTMAESLPNLVWTDLPDGRCDWLSSQWEKYTGIPVKELLGYNWLDRVIHPDDKDRTLARWRAACEDRAEYDLEYRIRRHDGEYHWFKTRGVPIRDASGKITYWFGTCTDIEDVKRAHVAIQRLASIVESSDDAIISTDLNGLITSWNYGASRLFGYVAEEIIGKPITTLTAPDKLAESAEILDKMRSGERIDHFETVRRKKDGALFNVSITVSPIRNQSGAVIGSSKVARDITDRVRAKERLEQTVAERTAALRDIVAELEAFSYSIAHDMRAPLRAMNSYAQIVREDYSPILPEEGRDFLHRIGTSARRLDALITDVLNYSRISRGDMPVENLDVGALFHEVIDSYPAIRAHAKDISVQPGIPSVRANKAALTQCVSNLLTNAVKFARDGVPPKVSVWCDQRSGFVRIWIEDNGIGISEEGRKRIFHMFQRLNPSPEIGGTGIGLTIVRKAVERMGGKTGVESQPSVGSRFWIELPAAE